MSNAEKLSHAMDRTVLAFTKSVSTMRKVRSFISDSLRRSRQDAAWDELTAGLAPISDEERAAALNLLVEVKLRGSLQANRAGSAQLSFEIIDPKEAQPPSSAGRSASPSGIGPR